MGRVSRFRGRPRCFHVGGRSWPVPNQGDARRDGGSLSPTSSAPAFVTAEDIPQGRYYVSIWLCISSSHTST